MVKQYPGATPAGEDVRRIALFGYSYLRVYRWATVGKRGRCGKRVTLEMWSTEDGLVTSTEAFRRWRERLNDPLYQP